MQRLLSLWSTYLNSCRSGFCKFCRLFGIHWLILLMSTSLASLTKRKNQMSKLTRTVITHLIFFSVFLVKCFNYSIRRGYQLRKFGLQYLWVRPRPCWDSTVPQCRSRWNKSNYLLYYPLHANNGRASIDLDWQSRPLRRRWKWRFILLFCSARCSRSSSGKTIHQLQICVLIQSLFIIFYIQQALRQEFEDEACSGLCEAVTRHLQEAEVMHTQGNSSFWWKVVEAALLSLGVVKDLLESQQKENQLPLDIVVILQSSLDQHNRMAGENNFGLNKKNRN